MNSKNLFLSKFYEFLINEISFFKEYKKVYIVNFLQLLKKKYPQIKITKNIKNRVSKFYDALFLKPALKYGNFTSLIDMKDFLTENQIDEKLLNKIALLMANSYIKTIFSSSDLEKLKTFTLLLDFYNKFIKNNIKNQPIPFDNQMPSFIKELYEKQSILILFGVYKGIPISNKTKILSIRGDHIKVKANNYQLIASKFQKEIYILDTKTNKTFKAYVKDFILHKKELILTDIKEIKRDALKRNYIRVQPKEDIEVIINLDKTYKGKMYDISIKGISILSEENIPININEMTEINFTLLNENFKFIVELKSISEYNNFYRYHFYFEPTPIEEEKLEKYITKREKEIINELTNYLHKEFIEL